MSRKPSEPVGERAQGCGRGALSALAPLFLLIMFVVLAALAFVYLRRGFGPGRDFTPPVATAPGLDGSGAPLLLGGALVVFALLGAGLLLLAVLLCCCKGRRTGLVPPALPFCALLDALKATATALEVSGAALEATREAIGAAGAEFKNANDALWEHVRVPAPSFPEVRALSDYGFQIPPGLPQPFVVTGGFGTSNIEIPGMYYFRVPIHSAATLLNNVGQRADEMNQLADHMKERQDEAARALRDIARLLEPLCEEEKKLTRKD